MDLGIAGRTAVVFGASKGIGRACAELLAAQGAKVALVARTPAALDDVATHITAHGGTALALPCDLAHAGALETAVARIKTEVGAPQIAVWSVTAFFTYQKLHNAPFLEISDELHREVAIPALMCKLLIPDMMRAHFGRLIFIGSLAALIGTKGAPIYGVSKAALEALSRSIAIDYSRYGITANVARLGFTDTERLRARIENEPERSERYAKAASTQRLVTPQEAAHAVAFLASQHAGAITGSVLNVTGGLELANTW